MNLEEILLIVNKEFETDTDEYMKRTTIITDIVYEGYNPLCITIDYLNEPYLTDLGVIRDIFERVSEEEWINLCSNHGFTFEKGMVFTVEPGIYIPEVLGVRIEDMLYVGKDGIEVLTQFPKEMIVI